MWERKEIRPVCRADNALFEVIYVSLLDFSALSCTQSAAALRLVAYPPTPIFPQIPQATHLLCRLENQKKITDTCVRSIRAFL